MSAHFEKDDGTDGGARIPLRNEQAVGDTWDLAPLYSSSQLWDEAFRELQRNYSAIGRFRGRVAESAATLRECLEAEKELSIADREARPLRESRDERGQLRSRRISAARCSSRTCSRGSARRRRSSRRKSRRSMTRRSSAISPIRALAEWRDRAAQAAPAQAAHAHAPRRAAARARLQRAARARRDVLAAHERGHEVRRASSTRRASSGS